MGDQEHMASRDLSPTASDEQGALPLPTSISDLTDGDLTLYWRLEYAEASLTIEETGHLQTYAWNAETGNRETYEGRYSLPAVKAFFKVLADGVGRAPRPPQTASTGPGMPPNPSEVKP